MAESRRREGNSRTIQFILVPRARRRPKQRNGISLSRAPVNCWPGMGSSALLCRRALAARASGATCYARALAVPLKLLQSCRRPTRLVLFTGAQCFVCPLGRLSRPRRRTDYTQCARLSAPNARFHAHAHTHTQTGSKSIEEEKTVAQKVRCVAHPSAAAISALSVHSCASIATTDERLGRAELAKRAHGGQTPVSQWPRARYEASSWCGAWSAANLRKTFHRRPAPL